MTKKELLSLGMMDVLLRYEKEHGEILSIEDKIIFLKGFNYACLLLTTNRGDNKL